MAEANYTDLLNNLIITKSGDQTPQRKRGIIRKAKRVGKLKI